MSKQLKTDLIIQAILAGGSLGLAAVTHNVTASMFACCLCGYVLGSCVWGWLYDDLKKILDKYQDLLTQSQELNRHLLARFVVDEGEEWKNV